MTRGSISRVYNLVRGRGPSLIIVSSVRAVHYVSVSSSSNAIDRIGRDTTQLLTITGGRRVPVFVIKRIGGSNTVTNPGIVRRVISAILCFRNSGVLPCHVLQTTGGHCNSAGRLNVFSVAKRKLRRVRGPSRVLLRKHPLNISNGYITYAVRNDHPVLDRVRTLTAGAGFPTPHHTYDNCSCGHVGLLVTILRGHTKCFFNGLSICVGVIDNVALQSATYSLTIYLDVISSLLSYPIDSGLVTVNRINLNNRIHDIPGLRRHLQRTRQVNFRHTIIPGRDLTRLGPTSCPNVGLMKTTCVSSTVRTLGGSHLW